MFSPRTDFILHHALSLLDAWMANILADLSNDPPAMKVVRNKPAILTDGCWTRETPPTFVSEGAFFGGPGTSFCNDLYPAFSFPRHVAGGPLANDVIQCELQPIDMADYAVSLTPEEAGRLQQIFPDGVCDWSRPGVGQGGLVGTWITFPSFGQYRTD
jgi:hypothetical protein